MAANQIVMDRNAVLGPIDPQLGDFAAASVLKVIERKTIDKIDDTTLILADQITGSPCPGRQNLPRSCFNGEESTDKAKEISHRLASGVWTHDFPITAEAAKELIGLPLGAGDAGGSLSTDGLVPATARRTVLSLLSARTALQEGGRPGERSRNVFSHFA